MRGQVDRPGLLTVHHGNSFCMRTALVWWRKALFKFSWPVQSFCKAYFSLTLPLPPTLCVENSDLPCPLNNDQSLMYYSPYYSPALRALTLLHKQDRELSTSIESPYRLASNTLMWVLFILFALQLHFLSQNDLVFLLWPQKTVTFILFRSQSGEA